jgi:hypothetical protein
MFLQQAIPLQIMKEKDAVCVFEKSAIFFQMIFTLGRESCRKDSEKYGNPMISETTLGGRIAAVFNGWIWWKETIRSLMLRPETIYKRWKPPQTFTTPKWVYFLAVIRFCTDICHEIATADMFVLD